MVTALYRRYRPETFTKLIGQSQVTTPLMAALRADRLVVTRQGVGAFVAENVRRPFRVDFDESSSLADVLNVMELRAEIGRAHV